jgi:hypothetical protein
MPLSKTEDRRPQSADTRDCRGPLAGCLGGSLGFLTDSAADQRHRLSYWAALGLLPPGLAPCSIAAAYVRATGRQPGRDPQRKTARGYTARELLAALAELLGRPPRSPAPRPAPAAVAPHRPRPLLRLVPPPAPAPLPADGLAVIWTQALRALRLPSTRMLLSQQSRLVGLAATVAGPRALVEVAPDWLAMVETRAELVREALAEVLGRPVALELREAGR